MRSQRPRTHYRLHCRGVVEARTILDEARLDTDGGRLARCRQIQVRLARYWIGEGHGAPRKKKSEPRISVVLVDPDDRAAYQPVSFFARPVLVGYESIGYGTLQQK